MTALIFAAILIVGGGAYVFTRDPSSSAPTKAADNTEQSRAEKSGKGSMASLLQMGNVKCDVSSQVGGTSQGTVYIAGGKMRADFTSQTQAGTFETHMINDGTSLYTWTDGVPQGVKLAAPDITAQTNASADQGGFDYSAQVDYTCGPWNEEPSMFTPPTSVSFFTPPTNF